MAGIELRSVYDEQARIARFRLEADGVAGHPISVSLGEREIARGGEVCDVAIADLLDLPSFDLAVRIGGESGQSTSVPDLTFVGDAALAISVRTEDEIGRILQTGSTRLKSIDLLMLGTKCAHARNAGKFVPQAMTLVVFGYRILDRAFAQQALTDADRRELAWFRSVSTGVIATGEALLDGVTKPDWKLLRWTISLCKAGGYLALLDEDYVEATRLLGRGPFYMPRVDTLPAKAASVMSMGCIYGVLLHHAGDIQGAHAAWIACVTHHARLVGCQPLFRNVHVYDEIVEIGKAARQCYVLLAVTGYIDANGRALPGAGRTFEPKEIWFRQVWNILRLGFAPDLKRHLLESRVSKEQDLAAKT